jgi:hypothetical protein
MTTSNPTGKPTTASATTPPGRTIALPINLLGKVWLRYVPISP